ncbi:hypothetical protein M3202_17570 [Alkalihalobacillus oceani]|uniref:Uncharacterized protein n=1 Tax=Halalkalibacter oceani TaxID=1653776 RepID=A0A9X2IRR8_9BACI|nr:hypothetical protein [Halalkalibacter oceani]MCM3715868.1 hypothetical protein [Halalkalibacter oceani]
MEYVFQCTKLNNFIIPTQPKQIDLVDAAYRIHEGRNLLGTLSWKETASAATKRGGRENPITLEKSYIVNWRTFSNIDHKDKAEFKVLIVEVS